MVAIIMRADVVECEIEAATKLGLEETTLTAVLGATKLLATTVRMMAMMTEFASATKGVQGEGEPTTTIEELITRISTTMIRGLRA